MTRKHALTVAFSGIDGSGKSTLVAGHGRSGAIGAQPLIAAPEI
jgi:predicted ATPase